MARSRCIPTAFRMARIPAAPKDSIGKTHTDELAVMVDTFRPLMVGKQALDVEDKDYYQSWLDR